MLKKLFPLLVSLALLVVGLPAQATNGIRMIGFSPVQNAMGGVGVGATLDAASMVTNPAGLTDLTRRLDVGLTLIKPSVSYRGAESPLPPPFTGAIIAQPDRNIESQRGVTPIPSLGFVTPLNDKLTAGIGLFGLSGLGVDYPANLCGGKTYVSYLAGRLTPSVAYKLSDLVSVGATVNLMMAQLEYDVAAGLGQQPHQTATSLGIGATVGLRVKPIEMISFGLAYESRSLFQDFEFSIPAHNGVNPADFSAIPFQAGKDKLDFDLPSSITAGVSVRPLGLLTLALDVQYIRWSETHGKNQPKYSSDITATGALPFDTNWSDQWVFKIGAEVGPWNTLTLRAGYNFGKTPLDPGRAFENIALPAISEHHFTFGAGLPIIPGLAVNVAGTYSPKASLAGSNGAYPSAGGQAIAYYVDNMSIFSIEGGVSYRF